MTDWYKVYSSDPLKPTNIDNTSSQFYVYERKNISQETIDQQLGDETVQITQWVFDERKYTKQEYEDLHSPVTEMIMQNLSNLELSIAEVSL